MEASDESVWVRAKDYDTLHYPVNIQNETNTTTYEIRKTKYAMRIESVMHSPPFMRHQKRQSVGQ